MSELQQTDAWHAQRIGKITGSRVGKILGLSAYGDRDDVLREMVREHAKAPPEFTGNVATQWGNDHEDVAIAAYEDRHEAFVESVGFTNHPNIDWLGASPDGLVGSDGLIEVKCPYRQRLFPLSERPDYAAQIQLQLTVTGRAWCDFIVWTPSEMTSERVVADSDWLASHLERLEAFQADYQAIINDPERAAPYLELTETPQGSLEWFEAASAYRQAQQQKQAALVQEKAAKQQLIELAGGQRSRGAGLLVYPTKGRTQTDYKRLIKEHLPGVDLTPYQKQTADGWAIR